MYHSLDLLLKTESFSKLGTLFPELINGSRSKLWSLNVPGFDLGVAALNL